MPSRSPFTRLCQLTAAITERGRADLHVHSTASDGLFTPQEVVAHARKAGLLAVAITDHDTLSGYEQVRGSIGIEVIAGVEISTEYQGRDLHLLGYFVDPRHPDLAAALADIRQQRRERFEAIAERLRAAGASIEEKALANIRDGSSSLGRRHLARLLVDTKQVGNVYEAFVRYLTKPEITELPKARLPVAEGIELVAAAGGVSSWAHPLTDASIDQMLDLQSVGLNAIESEYPWSKSSHGPRLKAMAKEAGLAITGGSDCHGPQPHIRRIGVKGINRAELDIIKALCSECLATTPAASQV